MSNSAAMNCYYRSRLEAIQRLGGKCVKCGFDDIRALQFDHVNSGGIKERLLNGWRPFTFYKEAANGQVSQQIQLLCANCNRIKACEQQESPPGKRVTFSSTEIAVAALVCVSMDKDKSGRKRNTVLNQINVGSRNS